ncbi:MAG: antibiotic biosynthesis monooxygenase [Burkholderiaceae bacterium]|jgi:heme-degrading monooxygenase HmoA|tara:strand:+ start:342 stop:632 length:291 start_codon:yes stop_codon:yes gene_type:complete
MILELADIRIHAGQHAAFEAAVELGISTVAAKANGFLGHTLHKGIESADRYVLQISWSSLEDHTVGFREGPLFPQWRAIVGPFFSQPPVVEHFNVA